MPGLFDISFDELPEVLPIFPLSGALLLPRCRLPLNIFEPRYLAMTEDALSGNRLIGMVQPTDMRAEEHDPELFETGCAGRISSFSETDDARLLVILTGVCRFHVVREASPGDLPYRRVVPDWEPFRHDLTRVPDGRIDRERLYALLRVYFEARGLDTDWDALQDAGDEKLINSLAMSCPFDFAEKQALIEADSLDERARLMLSLLDMAVLDPHDGDLPLH